MLAYDFSGHTAVVTGGSGGLGSDLCRALAGAGSNVAVVARTRAAVERTAAEIVATGGRAIGIAADCGDPDAVARMKDDVTRAFGPATLIATFAGGNGKPEPTMGVPLARWRDVQDINLSATFLVLKAFLPAMIAARKGSAVTMASSAARHAGQSSAAYAASKAGIVALTRHLANELGPAGIRLNCLAPSAIETGDLALQPQDIREKIAQQFPLRRLGRPGDVSAATLFLLSDAASWITGVTLDINGGRLMI